jgi:hypothetical protein
MIGVIGARSGDSRGLSSVRSGIATVGTHRMASRPIASSSSSRPTASATAWASGRDEIENISMATRSTTAPSAARRPSVILHERHRANAAASTTDVAPGQSEESLDAHKRSRPITRPEQRTSTHQRAPSRCQPLNMATNFCAFGVRPLLSSLPSRCQTKLHSRTRFEKIHLDPAPRTASPCTRANTDTACRCFASA